MADMNIATVVEQIDAQISTRSSHRFGIKMGGALYRKLFATGDVTIEKFGVAGTNFFVQDCPDYKKKYAVYMDPNMPPNDFEVGVP